MEPCEFGKRILSLLDERYMTQKQLAKAMGVNEATLSRYISGERIPRADNIIAMARAFCTSTDYLLGLKDIPEFCSYRLVRTIKDNSSKISKQDKRNIINALFDDDED